MTTLTTEQIAQVCHEANRALQLIGNDPAPSPTWDQAPQWQRDSAIAGVEAAIDGTTPEQQHDAWCNDRRAAGWTHGPVKDADAKTHPCLVPYHDLPAIQQAKDHVFGAIVRALGPPDPLDHPVDQHPGLYTTRQRFDAVDRQLASHGQQLAEIQAALNQLLGLASA